MVVLVATYKNSSGVLRLAVSGQRSSSADVAKTSARMAPNRIR
jgi:hypothetical protein